MPLAGNYSIESKNLYYCTMLDNLKKYHLILASNSPRRKELMSGLGIEYTVKTLAEILPGAFTKEALQK